MSPVVLRAESPLESSRSQAVLETLQSWLRGGEVVLCDESAARQLHTALEDLLRQLPSPSQSAPTPLSGGDVFW